MKFDKFRIAALSREPSFLLRTVLWILIPGLVIAFGISLLRKEENRRSPIEAMMDRIQRLNDRPPITTRHDCVRLLDNVRASRQLLSTWMRSADPGKKVLPPFPDLKLPAGASELLGPEELRLLINYRVIFGFLVRPDAEVMESFATAAAKEPVSGLLSSMHGDLLWSTGEYEAALAAYVRGAADAETGADSRRRALDLCRLQGWTERMRRLYNQPGWREAVMEPTHGYDRNTPEIASAAADWLGLLRVSWMNVEEGLEHPRRVIMSAMCGVLWFLIIHMAACVPLRQWWRGLLGFVMGVLSIPLTLFILTIQETWFDVRTSHATGDILYCVSGIGLREELAKLIMFVPMLFLLRKAQAAHVLAVAACVGLGFAIEENVGYFVRDGEVWGRFITANFLHFGLTGLTGLALWQAVRNSAWLTHFVWTLVGAVVFHGLWDFTPGDPRLADDYHYFVYAGLAVLSLYFFRELCRYAQPVPGVPSAVFVYLAGGSLLLSMVMSMTAWETGFRLALVATYRPVLALFVIGAAMFYQLRRA